MKAVIIAAGKGTRINDGKPIPFSKPLHMLFNKRLIETVILNLKSAGITDILVVVGFQADRVRQIIGNGTKYGVNITYALNEEYEKPLGFSILKAKQYVGNEDFIVSMSDHIFEPGIMEEFVSIKKERGTSVLCVDRKINDPKSLFDLDDACKILTDEKNPNKLVDAGKKIEKYNAVDCGIFYHSIDFLYALEEARKNLGDDKCNNDNAMKILAKKNKMFVHDIGNKKWIDVDTQKDYIKAKGYFKNLF